MEDRQMPVLHRNYHSDACRLEKRKRGGHSLKAHHSPAYPPILTMSKENSREKSQSGDAILQSLAILFCFSLTFFLLNREAAFLDWGTVQKLSEENTHCRLSQIQV